MAAVHTPQQGGRSHHHHDPQDLIFFFKHSSSLFRGLPSSSIRAIASVMTLTQLVEGECLIQAGQPGSWFGFLLAGTLMIVETDEAHRASTLDCVLTAVRCANGPAKAASMAHARSYTTVRTEI